MVEARPSALHYLTTASDEGRHILARSPRLARNGTTFQKCTPVPKQVVLPTARTVDREVEEAFALKKAEKERRKLEREERAAFERAASSVEDPPEDSVGV